jgi:hypothetical protein
MLPRPGHHDEDAVDVMTGATHHWIRFFVAKKRYSE